MASHFYPIGNSTGWGKNETCPIFNLYVWVKMRHVPFLIRMYPGVATAMEI